MLATLVIALLAVSLELTTLANFTSGVLLLVFAMVNAGLWWIKGLEKDRSPPGAFTLPRSVPLVGAGVSVSALVLKLVTSL